MRKSQYSGVRDIVFRLAGLEFFLGHIQQNMKQTSADTGVGHILTLEQITERSITGEGRQGIADPVGQIRRNILILVVACRVFRQQLVLQCRGKIIRKQRLSVPPENPSYA